MVRVLLSVHRMMHNYINIINKKRDHNNTIFQVICEVFYMSNNLFEPKLFQHSYYSLRAILMNSIIP